jgi:hypothetical protein
MIVAFVPDLMDRSKVSTASPGIDFVRAPGELAGRAAAVGATLALVDLSRDGALEAVRALAGAGSGVRVIGFGSHIDRARLEAARQAGCDEVLARSAFFSRLVEIVGS